MPIRSRSLLATLAIGLALSLVAADHAEARRGGGFGSRGGRTFQAPAITRTAPRPAAPIERSMTPRTQETQAGQPSAAQRQPAAQASRRGFFGGFGRSLLGGLVLGGLLGLLLGHGFGGIAGFFGLLLQLGLVALVVMLVLRFLRRRHQPEPAYAGAGTPGYRPEVHRPQPSDGAGRFAFDLGRGDRTSGTVPPHATGMGGSSDEIGITQDDLDSFERLLVEIQSAFAREDFGALRERTTPEVMSYFAEELGQNATRGLRNEVSDVRLLQGDLAESWHEDGHDHATVAMRYEGIELMRDRESGRVVEGDPERASETTEIWTFIRARGEPWKLSAIQDA